VDIDAAEVYKACVNASVQVILMAVRQDPMGTTWMWGQQFLSWGSVRE
jgi:hypothetical protein